MYLFIYLFYAAPTQPCAAALPKPLARGRLTKGVGAQKELTKTNNKKRGGRSAPKSPDEIPPLWKNSKSDVIRTDIDIV